MKLIKPYFEIWNQEEGLEGVYKQIERTARVCYKSEDKIAEGTAKKFVDRMIASGHGAMLEHGTIYLKLINMGDSMDDYDNVNLENRYIKNPYSKVVLGKRPIYNSWEEKQKVGQEVYITTNLRVLVENNWLDDLQYLCEPTKYHEKRITVKFTTQIAITREYNRHRVNSIAEQSTRYCNYANISKFDGVGINIPSWIDSENIDTSNPEGKFFNYCDDLSSDIEEYKSWNAIDYWLFANLACEFSYNNLIRLGWTAQRARTILPLDTNTELVHTAFVSDWEHFFELRDDKQHAHPDAYELAHPLHEEFIKRGYITE